MEKFVNGYNVQLLKYWWWERQGQRDVVTINIRSKLFQGSLDIYGQLKRKPSFTGWSPLSFCLCWWTCPHSARQEPILASARWIQALAGVFFLLLFLQKPAGPSVKKKRHYIYCSKLSALSCITHTVFIRRMFYAVILALQSRARIAHSLPSWSLFTNWPSAEEEKKQHRLLIYSCCFPHLFIFAATLPWKKHNALTHHRSTPPVFHSA